MRARTVQTTTLSVSRISRRLVRSAAVTAIVLGGCWLAHPAKADQITMCPSSAGTNPSPPDVTFTDVSGPLDSTCGPNSAVTISLAHSTDYGRLAFSSSTPGYPTGLTLGQLGALSANVVYSNSLGTDNPYYMLVFTDGSDSLGQASGSDQILLLQFQPATLTGDTLAVNSTSGKFNLFDNTTNTYLQGGQADTNTIAGWLGLFPALDGDALEQIRIAIGLTGGNTGPESLTVNSLTVTTPEPASLALVGVALAGLGVARRRRRA